MDRQSRAGCGEPLQAFALRHLRRARRGTCQDHGLRHARQGQLVAQRGSGSGKGRDAGGHVVGDAERLETTDLLGNRAVQRRIAGMDSGDISAPGVRRLDLADDLIEGQRRGVDDLGARRRGGDDFARHQRAGIEADRAALDQPQPAQRDQIRRPRPGADEMHGHSGASRK